MEDKALVSVYKTISLQYDTDIAAQVVIELMESANKGRVITGPPLRYARFIARRRWRNSVYRRREIPMSDLPVNLAARIDRRLYGGYAEGVSVEP